MDKYEKYGQKDLIGAGSFGTVYRVRKRGTSKTVALKVIPKRISFPNWEKELKELRRECEVHRHLKHRNIIRMIESFEIETALIVVTEWAKHSLFDLLRARNGKEVLTLCVDEVRTIACHLTSALHYVHSLRIVHRDIKPQNVLIGFDSMYKLCDFGFARRMDPQTYLLTSLKGTPLYMAPEIYDNSPYDFNTDLWSFGCLLYEVLVGLPPFPCQLIDDLKHKIDTESVFWHDHITGDCLLFLQGLLEKDPEKRLSWPKLVDHPFVAVPGELCVDRSQEEFSLTKTLSPSQELKKEHERQNILHDQKMLHKKQIKEAKTRYMSSPSSNLVLVNNNCGTGQRLRLSKFPGAGPTPSIHHHTNKKPDQNNPLDLETWRVPRKLDEDEAGGSSCETLSSSSEIDARSEDDDGTVIVDGQLSTESLLGTGDENHNGSHAKVCKSPRRISDVWNSGALFTLHSFGSEDKPIECEEWIDFLLKTMKEVIQAPSALCEKHFLTMLVAPLRNHLASAIVVEKIASLLSLPFALEDKEDAANLTRSLENIYLDTKVVPNLLYSCKLTVRRRTLEGDPVDLEDIVSILTEEDLEAMDKSLRLVCFLVYSEDDFVVQFCDSICILQAFAVLQLFLKLDKRMVRLTTDTLGILCQVMKTIPTNVSILEDLFLENGLNGAELWRLLTHTNPLIQSRMLRILGYLVLHSGRTRDEVVRKNGAKVWRILRNASGHPEADVRSAAGFATENIRCLGPTPQQSSSSTTKPVKNCDSR